MADEKTNATGSGAPGPGSSPGPAIGIELEAPESWKRVAHVTVTAEHMESQRVAAARALGKKAKLPGFRPGKVPLKILRQNFAAQIEQEALEKVVPAAYREVLAEHDDLHPIADPRVENLQLEEGQPVRFDMVIEVRPDLELKGYDELQVERVEMPISGERVEQALSELAERNARWVPVERGAQPGDAMRIDYAPLDETGQPIESERDENYALELGSEGVLPEFDSALRGLQPGEDTQVEVTYPEDYPRKELAGKTMLFQVVVKEIREKQVPAVDDDLARSVSSHQTLEELRAEVRAELERAAGEEADRQMRQSMIEKIEAANDIPVPPTLEARYVQAMVQDYAKMTGRELGEEDRKQVAERLRPSAQRASRRMIILDNIRRREGIEVSPEDIDERIREMAERRSAAPEDVRRAVEASGHLDRLEHDLEEEKVFAFLEEKAKITVVLGETHEGEAPAAGPAPGHDQQSKE